MTIWYLHMTPYAPVMPPVHASMPTRPQQQFPLKRTKTAKEALARSLAHNQLGNPNNRYQADARGPIRSLFFRILFLQRRNCPHVVRRILDRRRQCLVIKAAFKFKLGYSWAPLLVEIHGFILELHTLGLRSRCNVSRVIVFVGQGLSSQTTRVNSTPWPSTSGETVLLRWGPIDRSLLHWRLLFRLIELILRYWCLDADVACNRIASRCCGARSTIHVELARIHEVAWRTDGSRHLC